MKDSHDVYVRVQSKNLLKSMRIRVLVQLVCRHTSGADQCPLQMCTKGAALLAGLQQLASDHSLLVCKPGMRFPHIHIEGNQGLASCSRGHLAAWLGPASCLLGM